MPPKYTNNKGEPLWVFETSARDANGKHTIYKPKCRFDEFIASHTTCCEYHTNYFAYFHRNMIAQYLLALNEADFAMRDE